MPGIVASSATRELREMAELIDQISAKASHPTPGQRTRGYPELEAAGKSLDAINEVLEQALKTGSVTPAEERRIAGYFRDIATTLEKGAG